MTKEITAQEASDKSFEKFKQLFNQNLLKHINNGESVVEFSINNYSDSFYQRIEDYLTSRGFQVKINNLHLSKQLSVSW